MTRRKGDAPTLAGTVMRGGADLFDVDDLHSLHRFAKVAESDVLLPPDAMVWRLRDAFTGAIAFGALAKADPPPAEHRDYLARIAKYAESLCQELEVPFADTARQIPNLRQVTNSLVLCP